MLRQYRLAESIVKLFKRRERGQKSRFPRTERTSPSLYVCFRLLHPTPESEKVMKQRSYLEANTGSHLVVRRADIFLLRFKYQRQSKTCGWRKGEEEGESKSWLNQKHKAKLKKNRLSAFVYLPAVCSHCLFFALHIHSGTVPHRHGQRT